MSGPWLIVHGRSPTAAGPRLLTHGCWLLARYCSPASSVSISRPYLLVTHLTVSLPAKTHTIPWANEGFDVAAATLTIDGSFLKLLIVSVVLPVKWAPTSTGAVERGHFPRWLLFAFISFPLVPSLPNPESDSPPPPGGAVTHALADSSIYQIHPIRL